LIRYFQNVLSQARREKNRSMSYFIKIKKRISTMRNAQQISLKAKKTLKNHIFGRFLKILEQFYSQAQGRLERTETTLMHFKSGSV